jgi:hypothetical protein
MEIIITIPKALASQAQAKQKSGKPFSKLATASR